MRLLVLVTAILLASLQAASAQYVYDDAYNVATISANVCRGEDAASEDLLYHRPGAVSLPSWRTRTVTVYCPINRRNLHAYSDSGSSPRDLAVEVVVVRVSSPSGRLRCRLFAKHYRSGVVTYSDWHNRYDTGREFRNFIYFVYRPEMYRPGDNITIRVGEFETVNWGLQCEIPPGEAIETLLAMVKNNNS